ncbi:RNA polymerase sigma factor [Dactylosporangium roseum]|uniref:RNA polymerase sigma factor n=1 Tax=Dactylosporangium roseum TaxID=47989 RepID=A0ABY5ZCS8_9ACTN|nr:DUF6596 domain-containing protein [Dactylosporangium roseum]UWZ38788.1 RNA polymerase sigma factor [Dactylosporangium roseum]
MAQVEELLRTEAPHVLAALVRHRGDFETCEDAVQEALLAAALQWPVEGVPANPRGWLITVASRRWIAQWRADTARRRREALAEPPVSEAAPPPASSVDDSLSLLMLCCHPALTPPSQVALTLRAVGGLTTAEIARAYLVPEATIAQRVSRAKQRIKATGATFRPPSPDEFPARLDAALQVLYLVFNEGYTATSGTSLHRVDLTAEALRLTRELYRTLPHLPPHLRQRGSAPGHAGATPASHGAVAGEVAGLLALMLLTDARRPARTGPGGALIPLAEQDRSRWDQELIAEGRTLLTTTLNTAPIGPFQLQAAIAAVHDEAQRPEDTDWPQILALYDLLAGLSPGPMVTLNRVVAVAMVDGPDAGLAALDKAASDPALAGHHRVPAVRGHLLDQAGRRDEAREAFEQAANLTESDPERRYLLSRAAPSPAGPSPAGPAQVVPSHAAP